MAQQKKSKKKGKKKSSSNRRRGADTSGGMSRVGTSGGSDAAVARAVRNAPGTHSTHTPGSSRHFPFRGHGGPFSGGLGSDPTAGYYTNTDFGGSSMGPFGGGRGSFDMGYGSSTHALPASRFGGKQTKVQFFPRNHTDPLPGWYREETQDPGVGLLDSVTFPPFRHLTWLENPSEDYYTGWDVGRLRPSRHWAFLGTITDVMISIRVSVGLMTRFGEKCRLYFHPETPMDDWYTLSYLSATAAALLWIEDAAINASMEPMRALVADVLPVSQRTFGFAMQTTFTGIGAVLASACPWVLRALEVQGGEGVGNAVVVSFLIGAFVYLVCVLITVCTTHEPSQTIQLTAADVGEDVPEAEAEPDVDQEMTQEDEMLSPPPEPQSFMDGVRELGHSVTHLPKNFARLGIVHIVAWLAQFAYNLYWPPFVGQHVFGGNPSAPEGSEEYHLYLE
ncbi:hypothetical protein KIPB_006908, partial [Kipferlia bialata]|eukprot:g6908.t1